MRAVLLLSIVFIFASAELLTRTKVLMGTFATIKLDANESRHFSEAFERLQKVEDALSSYKPSSPIFLLNQNKLATLYPLTYEALQKSLDYYDVTDGYFNIAIGSVTKDLYRFGEQERLPSSDLLRKSSTTISELKFTEKKASISNNIKIDLGGMGKGFGVDKAVKYLHEKGVRKGVVGLSGDIRCLNICKMQIQNPFLDGVLAEFTTKHINTSISTSGNYNRYVRDTAHNHLINPKTKISQKSFASITLISELSNSDIDAYATAASVMPKELSYAFLDSLALAYIIIESDGKRVVSENIDAYVSDLRFEDGVK